MDTIRHTDTHPVYIHIKTSIVNNTGFQHESTNYSLQPVMQVLWQHLQEQRERAVFNV